MSATYGRLAGPVGGVHPVVLNRRLHSLLLVGLSVLLPLAIALPVTLTDSHPSFVLAFALVVGAVAIVALVTNKRLEVTVTVVALYLGLLEGPVKLGSGGHSTASVVRDIVIWSVALGAVLRLLSSRQRIRLPPLSPWVIAFVLLVLADAFNPQTHGLTKVLGGFRQQLEWVPFFFFGYALMRSKRRFRQAFLVLGVIALANGAVSTYQTRLSPGQLASWGPGYRELAFGTVTAGVKGGLSGRAFSVEGESRVRPPGLGTDAGFGAGTGVLALTATLALLASVGLRRRWPIVLLFFGALAGIATGEGRLQVVGAVLAVLTFAILSFTAGGRVTRTLAVLIGVVVLAIPIGAVFVSAIGSGTFARYASLNPSNVSSNSRADGKVPSLAQIPKQLARAPFGIGLGSVGAAGGFGGLNQQEGLQQQNSSAETQYNFVSDELGIPGLLLFAGFSLRLIVLALRRLRGIADLELRLYLAAMFATFIAYTLMGFSGPTMASAAFGPFFWFCGGTAAYWFVAKRGRPAPPARVAEAV